MDLLQLLAPAELPKVFDVLGEGAFQDGDFQSVFDQFLQADIQSKLEEGEALSLDQDLLEGVLETLTEEQSSVFMSFLVQVQIAIEDPSLVLTGLLDKASKAPELENTVPGSPGFAMRSLELAFEFTSHQIEKGAWEPEEATKELSAYLKHWLKHEPCLDCKEPSFFASHELVPAEEYLSRIEGEKKILPQKQKPTDMFLLPTQKSDFKIPFFTTFKVEEVHAKPITPLQNEVQTQQNMSVNEEVETETIELSEHLKPSTEDNGEKQEELLAHGNEQKKPAKESSGSVLPELKQKNITIPQVHSRVEKALNWFAEQVEQIGKPEDMQDDDWQKIMEWMQAKKSKSAKEAMQQLERLGQLRRLNGETQEKATLNKPSAELLEQDEFAKTESKTKSARFQRAFAEAYQVVKAEEQKESPIELLKNYASDKPELDASKLQKPLTQSHQDSSSQLLGQVKSSEAKVENTPTTPKFTPPPSSNWDPELLNKFLQSTKESLKIWVEKKYVAMRIQIEPAELGKIQLKTIVEQGRIGVLIQAENQMTKELLQIHLHEMKEILKEQGLEVAGFQVDVKEQKQGFAEQKSSSGAKFELETLLEDDNVGAELSSGQAKGLIDQVA